MNTASGNGAGSVALAFYPDIIEHEEASFMKIICVAGLHDNCRCPKCRAKRNELRAVRHHRLEGRRNPSDRNVQNVRRSNAGLAGASKLHRFRERIAGRVSRFV